MSNSRGSLFWEKLPARDGLQKGRNYLLAIGIDKYQHFDPLHNAVKDVSDFLKVMVNRYQFEEAQAEVLLNKDATQQHILDALDRLEEVVEEKDNVIIYFSGHGTLDRRKRGYWLPVDAKPGFKGQFIFNSAVRDYIADIRSRHTLLIVDSCFSGTMTKKVEDATAFSKRVEHLPSRWLLTSGRSELVSDGRPGKNSPFASCLLKFLQHNKANRLPVSELVQHVKRTTPRNANQTPYGSYMHGVGDQDGEFIFRLRPFQQADQEKLDWEKAQQADTEFAYKAYRDQYPKGKYRTEALKRMRIAGERTTWIQAKRQNTLWAYEAFLDAHSESTFADEARAALTILMAASKTKPVDAAWENARNTHSLIGYASFRKDFPESEYDQQALTQMAKIEQNAWDAACKLDTEDVYRAYHRDYPDSTYRSSAKEKLNERKADRLWQEALGSQNMSDFREFLDLYPNHEHSEDAIQRISELTNKMHESAMESIASIRDTQPALPIPEMVFVKGGSFMMGSEEGDDREKPIHQVVLDDFEIGKYPVTFEEYDAFCEATDREKPEDRGWGRKARPVIRLTWNDAQAYAQWLSDQTDKSFRLPTEAEWEYAARGGQNSQGFLYAGSDEVEKVAWYYKNSGDKTQPVGQKQANELGLYEMSGNVWEWCGDMYRSGYSQQPLKQNPKGPDSGAGRVVRGGGWAYVARTCRVSYRHYFPPGYRVPHIGFRLVVSSQSVG